MNEEVTADPSRFAPSAQEEPMVEASTSGQDEPVAAEVTPPPTTEIGPAVESEVPQTGDEPEADLDHSVTHAEIVTLIEGVGADVRKLSAHTDFYEDLVRQLQGRLEALQTDQIQQLLGPVFTKLAILLTQSAESASLAKKHGEGYQADVEFEYFHEAIIETLDLVGVVSVEAKIGDAFDRAIHASRKSIPTHEQHLDWTLAKVMRQGLTRLGAERAFIPAQVAVFRYDSTIEPPVGDRIEAMPQAPSDSDTAPDNHTTNSQPNQEGN